MTPDERQMLAGLFDRVRGAANAPRDREAEAFIADAVRAQPWAPYILAQTVIVQENNMAEAAARIEELEERVRQLESPASAGSGSFLGGGGGSFLGGAAARSMPSAPPQPAPSPWSRAGAQQAPAYSAPPPPAPSGWQQPQAGAWQQPQAAAPPARGGFLKSALGMAAGVAGGAMLASSLSGMFGGNKTPDHSASGASAARGDDPLLDPPQQFASNNYTPDNRDFGSQDYAEESQPDTGSFDTAGYSSDDSSEA